MQWPAIIKYAGEAELGFFSSQSAWDDVGLHVSGHQASYQALDVLIDSSGEIYSIANKINGLVEPAPSGRTATLHELIEMVRAHASVLGSCCVSKFYAASIPEAILMVNSIEP
jgi:hypothetical protein